MSTARRDPLLPGVYWVDLFQPSDSAPKQVDQVPIFNDWVEESDSSAKVLSREGFEPDPVVPGISGMPRRVFTVFQILEKPAPFPFKQLGFPTIVKLGRESEITEADRTVTSDETVQKPNPQKDALDKLQGMLKTAEAVAVGVAFVWTLHTLGSLANRAKGLR